MKSWQTTKTLIFHGENHDAPRDFLGVHEGPPDWHKPKLQNYHGNFPSGIHDESIRIWVQWPHNHHFPRLSSSHEQFPSWIPKKVQISCIRIWGSAEAKGGAVKAHGHMMVSVLEATHPQGLQILRWESLGSHSGVTWEATDLYLEGKTGFACSSGTCWCVFLVQCVIFTRLCLMPRVQIFYLGECVCESSAPNTSRSKTSGWNALLRWMDDVVTFQVF